MHHPRVTVCGLNPHAGEGGILGDEDERIIAPAIRIAKENGTDATGPPPATPSSSPRCTASSTASSPCTTIRA